MHIFTDNIINNYMNFSAQEGVYIANVKMQRTIIVYPDYNWSVYIAKTLILYYEQSIMKLQIIWMKPGTEEEKLVHNYTSILHFTIKYQK